MAADDPGEFYRGVAVDPTLGSEDDVEHLAFAGVIRSEQVAGADFHAQHAAGRNAGENGFERIRLGRGARAVEHDVAGRTGEPADIAVGLLDREAGHPTDDVEGVGGGKLGEERCVIGGGADAWLGRGGDSAGRGLGERGSGDNGQCHHRCGTLCGRKIVLSHGLAP
ncbi:hypothetical protein GKE62_02615 [Novosphingobium sp. Gsoil 351]|nr:hypothetical protein GKE62_02615 [Novosphingobium sp. Gsoil 351]